jgi:hypothetical protein
MMLDCAEAARIERDYANALEYLLAVASVDNHPKVTAALADTLLDIVEALKLAPGAADAKDRLTAGLSRNVSDFDYGALRESLNSGQLLHVLDLTRLFAIGLYRGTQADGMAAALIGEINSLLIEEEERQDSIGKKHKADRSAARPAKMRPSGKRSYGLGRIGAAMTAVLTLLIAVALIFHGNWLLNHIEPGHAVLSPAGTLQPPLSEEVQAWIAVKSTSSEAALQGFIDRFPDSIYVSLARARIRELKQKRAGMR